MSPADAIEAQYELKTIRLLVGILEQRIAPDGTILGRSGFALDLEALEAAVVRFRALALPTNTLTTPERT